MTDDLFRDDRVRWAHETLHDLATLDHVTAQALLLVYHHHVIQPQVATQLGLPEAEVKTRIAEGMRELGRVAVRASTGPEQRSRVLSFAPILRDPNAELPAGPSAVAR